MKKFKTTSPDVAAQVSGGRMGKIVSVAGGLTPEQQVVFKKPKPTDPTEGFPKPENPSI